MRRLLVVLVLVRAARVLVPAGLGEPGLRAEGQRQLQRLQELEELEELGRRPDFGRCWSGALAALPGGCRRLDGEVQSRLALAFAHCHLQRSGKPYPPCGPTDSVLSCTQGMDPVAFVAYTEFFTHTHSICHYLQSEAWQREAEDTMDRLALNSENVAQQLETTNQMAIELLEAQNVTLRAQEEILRNGDALKHTLRESTQGVRQVFLEMQQSTQEQQLVFAEIFQRLSYLHQFVMVESTAFYSFLYNLLACVVAFLLTATRRTAGARLSLFLLIAVGVYLERLIYTSQVGPSESSFDHTERVYTQIWLLRRFLLLVGSLLLAYSALTYRDPGQQTQEILQSLRETQSHLRHLIREAERVVKGAARQEGGPEAEDGPAAGGGREAGEEPPPSKTALQLEELSPCPSSPPGKLSDSRTPRRRKARRSDVSVYNVLVSDSASKYNLRKRTSSGRGPELLR